MRNPRPAEQPAVQRERVTSARPRDARLAIGLLSASVLALVVELWATLLTPHRATSAEIVRELLFAAAWILVGAVAIRLDRTALAVRLLAFALFLSVAFAGAFGLVSDAPYARVLATVHVMLIALQTPLTAHLLLAYPSGRLQGATARRIVAAAFILGGIEAVLLALGSDRLRCPECSVSYTYVGLPESSRQVLFTVLAVAWAVLAALFLRQLLRQFRAAGTRQRRLLRLPYLAILLTVFFYLGLLVVAATRGASAWALSEEVLIVVQVLALLGVPLSFLVSLVRERFAHKRIGEFLVAAAPGAETDLEQALGTALGDGGLTVAYPVKDGFVDGRGRAVPRPVPTPTAQVTAVGDPLSPLALITHDRSLADEPVLLTAAGSAVRLLLENARLHSEVRAQLLEVRESRSRIIEATDTVRVQLERDLHDGAQQRLLAIGLALNLLEKQPDDAEVLTHAKEEVAGALAELRALAAGIHPAVLTDLGLVAALDALAQRMRPLVAIRTAGEDLGRLPAPVEAAAYFSTAEAVTNAVKHSGACTVIVTVGREAAELVVTIADDGIGGADPAAPGLLNIRDRIASVDGSMTVRSPSGEGTEVKLVIPCG